MKSNNTVDWENFHNCNYNKNIQKLLERINTSKDKISKKKTVYFKENEQNW